MGLPEIRTLVAADLVAVDEIIRTRLSSQVALVGQVAEHIVTGGGKRLRPLVVLLAAQAAARGKPPADAPYREAAAFIEFIHTATLLHDDVVDESGLRRGHRTANATFGNAASVLVGDFLYSRAFQMMLKVDDMRVMAVLAEATNTIAEGEVLQLLNVHNADTDEARYLEVVRRKTAKLFEAATRLGAILGKAPAEIEQGLALYGMHVGTAFQLIDDVLDYSGDLHETGKNLGDDLNEGKPTLPLIYAMRKGSPAQAQTVRHAIEQGGRDDFQAVLEAITNTGALDYAREQAGHEAAAACSAIERMPNSKYRDSLLQLADFAVNRKH